jgi:hypothetical protein
MVGDTIPRKYIRKIISFWMKVEKKSHTEARTTSLWFNERAFIFTKTSKLPSGGVLTIRVFRPSDPEASVKIHSFD